MKQSSNPGNTLGAELRFVFVEMLFALTIAEVATQVATVAQSVGISQALSSYTHLALATILIAASWIGWKNSVAEGNKVPVTEIFSLGFLVLLLDVALVVFYFILVRGAEKPVNGIVIPSTENETNWILIIFIGYFFWDVLTKAVPGSLRSFPKRLFGKELWGRGWITAICLILAVLIRWLLIDSLTLLGVVLTDLTLLLLVFALSSAKRMEKPRSGDARLASVGLRCSFDSIVCLRPDMALGELAL